MGLPRLRRSPFSKTRGNKLRRAERHAPLSPVHVVQPTSYTGGRIPSRGRQEIATCPLCVTNLAWQLKVMETSRRDEGSFSRWWFRPWGVVFHPMRVFSEFYLFSHISWDFPTFIFYFFFPPWNSRVFPWVSRRFIFASPLGTVLSLGCMPPFLQVPLSTSLCKLEDNAWVWLKARPM